MAITKLYRLDCDGDDCGHITGNFFSKEEAVKWMLLNGWIKKSNKIYCKKCATNHPLSKRGRKPKTLISVNPIDNWGSHENVLEGLIPSNTDTWIPPQE